MKTFSMLCAAVSAACVALPSLGGDWFHPDCEPEPGVAIMDDPCTGTVKPIQRRNFVQAGSGRAAARGRHA